MSRTCSHAVAGAVPSGQSVRLPLAVNAPAAAEVVRRKLDNDLVARQDLDPVAAHLARRVAQRLLPVLEEDLVHPAAECLDHLAFHLDLLFLGYESPPLVKVPVLRPRSCEAAAQR